MWLCYKLFTMRKPDSSCLFQELNLELHLGSGSATPEWTLAYRRMWSWHVSHLMATASFAQFCNKIYTNVQDINGVKCWRLVKIWTILKGKMYSKRTGKLQLARYELLVSSRTAMNGYTRAELLQSRETVWICCLLFSSIWLIVRPILVFDIETNGQRHATLDRWIYFYWRKSKWTCRSKNTDTYPQNIKIAVMGKS